MLVIIQGNLVLPSCLSVILALIPTGKCIKVLLHKSAGILNVEVFGRNLGVRSKSLANVSMEEWTWSSMRQ